MYHKNGAHYRRGYNSSHHLARLVALISKTQRKTDKAPTDQNYENSKGNALARYTLSLTIATWIIAGAAILNFLASLLQWSVLNSTEKAMQRQVGVMQNQLAVMVADQRPWIKVEATIAGPFTFFEPAGFADMPRHFTLTNVGHSPAFNVRLTAWSFLLSLNHHDLEREWEERCENFKRIPLDNPARGMILFPSDQMRWNQSGIGLAPDDINKNTIDEGGEKGLDVWIYGCADYVFGEPKAHHQTGFVYRLGHLTPSKGVMALSFRFEPHGTFPAESLTLSTSQSASGQTD